MFPVNIQELFGKPHAWDGTDMGYFCVPDCPKRPAPPCPLNKCKKPDPIFHPEVGIGSDGLEAKMSLREANEAGIFQARLERRKNRQKMRKNQTFPLFGVGFAVVPRLLGKGKDRGKNTSDRIARTNCSKECRDWPAVIGQSQLEINLARRWHTFGGRRIELPPGGATAASPFVGKTVGGLPCI